MGREYRDGARISFLYHSGVGGTRLVAELLGEILASKHATRVVSIHDPKSAEALAASDLLVLCFPTYYLKPSPSMTEFIFGLPAFDSPPPTYLIATKELYTENCIRSCALTLKKKGFTVAGSRVVRAPGTDVTVLVPAWLCTWLYRFEKNIHGKLRSIADEIHALVSSDNPRERIPGWKWYTPFTQLFQVLILNHLDAWRNKVRILPDRCTLCGGCVADCDRGAWIREGGELRHLPDRCELCTRCMHRCARKAIVLIEGLKDNPRLDKRLYRGLKEGARQRLRESGVDLGS